MKNNNNVLILSAASNHYSSLDGFRAISCLGIMFMHIQANTQYELAGFVWDVFIPSFTQLVLLFLMISGFGMCAGYLEKFHTKTIDLEQFYRRRYRKILPYFVFLIVIAMLYEPSLTNFYDATMEILLIYGFLPNNALNVIGVGWTLGVVFVFYFLFPAFSVLLKTKRRAWLFLIVSLWVNFVCRTYYFSESFVISSFAPRHAFLWCAPLFIYGGVVFLYRTSLSAFCDRFRFLLFSMAFLTTVLQYVLPNKIGNIEIAFYKTFFMYAMWLMYGVGTTGKILGSRVMKFFSNISLEIYLSHMFVFRFFEKLHLQYLFGKANWFSYMTLCCFVLIGVLLLVYGFKTLLFLLKRMRAHFL